MERLFTIVSADDQPASSFDLEYRNPSPPKWKKPAEQAPHEPDQQTLKQKDWNMKYNLMTIELEWVLVLNTLAYIIIDVSR